ncbi:MAG TPA: HWE histidine kinase domain-containing protein [Bradyrhizobium sp.]|jgi:two-component sensor histidine kinase|nr:HWE histidine kinase domain-containing protein [Bradyrhizobium sp.]
MPSATTSLLRSELTAAGDGLADNEDVLRSVLAGCGDCIKILDLDGRLQFMSEGGKRVMEVDDFGPLKGCPWPDFWAGDGSTDARRAVEVAKAGGIGRFKGPANTAKGNPRHWDVQVSPIMGADGKPSHLLSISRDITEEWRAVTELKESVERQEVLALELQHRIKNTLAMVGAIANQTMQGDSVANAREAFAARLMTLSRAHDLLTQSSWASAPIRDVVEGALAAHRTGRSQISVSGPDLHLTAKQALALAVAIHELATNATKYGALSGRGSVAVAWSDRPAGGVETFSFTWTESGGPAVTEPEKKGFGSRLIEKMLPNDFGGQVRTSYRPDGVVCELTSPLGRLNSDG